MPNSVSFNVTYDAGSDVLYISVRREAASRATEDSHGIVWRYAGDGSLIGATIMDFADIWSDKGEELADEIARRFDMPAPQALVVVERALRGLHH